MIKKFNELFTMWDSQMIALLNPKTILKNPQIITSNQWTNLITMCMSQVQPPSISKSSSHE